MRTHTFSYICMENHRRKQVVCRLLYPSFTVLKHIVVRRNDVDLTLHAAAIRHAKQLHTVTTCPKAEEVLDAATTRTAYHVVVESVSVNVASFRTKRRYHT